MIFPFAKEVTVEFPTGVEEHPGIIKIVAVRENDEVEAFKVTKYNNDKKMSEADYVGIGRDGQLAREIEHLMTAGLDSLNINIVNFSVDEIARSVWNI